MLPLATPPAARTRRRAARTARPAQSVVVLVIAAVALGGCQKLQARMELKKGNQLYKNETYREALEQFQKGLELDPSATFAWRSVGLTAMALYRPGVETEENQQYAEIAIDAFKRYVRAYPHDEKAEEYLDTMLINAGRYDEALARLKAQPAGKPGVHQAIVTVLSRAGRYDEALAWAQRPEAGKLDPQVFYAIGVACWDKSYNDPMLDSVARGRVVDTGLAATKRALELKPDYFEAMAYYNLLFREKAKLETDPEKAAEWTKLADEWMQKAIALREREKRAEEAAKKAR
jgi:tetratricopeptide (TPR) repeat protein